MITLFLFIVQPENVLGSFLIAAQDAQQAGQLAAVALQAPIHRAFIAQVPLVAMTGQPSPLGFLPASGGFLPVQ